MKKMIFDALHEMCDGKTNQDEIAKKLGISRPYLNRLLNKKRPIDGISIHTLLKLFPHATLNLNGDNINMGTNHGVVGINNGTVNADSGKSVEAFRDRALKVLMDLDIPPDALLKVLKTLKDLQI